MTASRRVTKSVRLDPKQSEQLAQISQAEGISEAALMQRFVLDGIAHHRLEAAVQAYTRGEVDLAAAARHAQVSVYHKLKILAGRDVSIPAASEKFVEGLKSLVETFGGSDALRQTITQLENRISLDPLAPTVVDQPARDAK